MCRYPNLFIYLMNVFSLPPKNQKFTRMKQVRPHRDLLVRRHNAEVATGKSLAYYV